MTATAYTPELAKAASALVATIAGDLASAREQLPAAERAFDRLRARKDSPQRELNEAFRLVRRLEAEIGSCLAELDQLGVHVEDEAAGIYGFPASLEGREIVLSWKLDEDGVEWFRDADDDPGVRHPLPVPAHAG